MIASVAIDFMRDREGEDRRIRMQLVIVRFVAVLGERNGSRSQSTLKGDFENCLVPETKETMCYGM